MKRMRGLTKRITGFLLCLVLVLANIPASALAVTYQGSEEAIGIRQSDFLKADGKLVRKNYGTGEVTYLRGTNAGGYLLQEFWMCLTDYTDNVRCEMEMYNKLTERFGKETMLELMDYYQDNYWTEQDFDNCAAMGMNCIRLPFWYRNLVDENGNLYSNAWERMDWFIQEAGERGIYVILDMHGAPGSQNGRDHSGVDGDENRQTEIARSEFFWGNNAEKNQKLYYSLWEQIAGRYKDNPVVAGYDLLNEPYCAYRYESGKSDDELHSLLWGIYDKAYDKIRAIDPNHMIIMEATWDPWDLPNPADYGWSNVMYEYHNYMYGDDNNENGTQISGMQNKINNIKNFDYYNVPSYMGEFNYFNQAGVWEEGLQLLNNSGLHWSTWTYKTTWNVGNWGIYYHTGDNRVNIETDSVDDIRRKWANVKTSSENTTMVNVLKKYLPGVNKTSQYVSLDNGDYYLTVNGKVVKAQNGGNAPLAAVSDSYTGDAEKLTVVNNSDGTISFKSAANGKYVCADLNEEDSRLIARSDKIEAWEKFYAVRVSDTQIGLLAVANGRFIKGDFNNGQGNVLKAENDRVAGAWESFEVKKTNGETVNFGDKTGEDNVVDNPGVSETGNIIRNPLFEAGTENWATYVQEGDAAATFEKHAKAGLNVNIRKTGTMDWHVQLAQNNLQLEAGYQYKVSVDLISSASRTVRVALEKFVSDSDVVSYGVKDETLQAKTRTTINFTTDELTESTDFGKLYIGLGNVSGEDTASKVTICSVNVVPVKVEPQEIKVTGIVPSATNVELKEGEQQTLTIEVIPDDATNKEIEYRIDNPGVATITESGFITAVGAGSATITIAAKDGSGVTRTVEVTVIKEVTDSEEEATTEVGSETTTEEEATTEGGSGTTTEEEATTEGGSGTTTEKEATTEGGSGTTTEEEATTEAGNGTQPGDEATTEEGSGMTTEEEATTEEGSGTQPGDEATTEEGSGTTTEDEATTEESGMHPGDEATTEEGSGMHPEDGATTEVGNGTHPEDGATTESGNGMQPEDGATTEEGSGMHPENGATTEEGRGTHSGDGATTEETGTIVTKGTTFVLGKYKYKITGVTEGKYTVELTGPVKKTLKTVVIPASVKYQGRTFKVTSVGKKAFRNNKKIKKVTIGKNVTSIGANAFYGCKNLKTVRMKSSNVKKIGKNAFRSIRKKATIKVPSKKLNTYKRMLKKAKLSSGIKIKK